MGRRRACLVFDVWVLVLSVAVFGTPLNILVVSGSGTPGTWTVDDDGPADFSSIQEAINSQQVMDRDTIYVYNGTYDEDVVVDKAVSLIGEGKNAVILGYISVLASNVTIRGFTIQSRISIGSFAYSASNVTVRDNFIVNGGIQMMARFDYPYGMFCNNTIEENHILNATMGILVTMSRGNKIIGNTLIGNDVGILLDSGNNTVSDNHVEGGGVGIHLNSGNNTLTNNALLDNMYNFGFGLAGAYPNTIDTTNTINDRPIYLLANQSNIRVDPVSYPSPGYLALINCENVTVRDFVLSGNGQGILLQGGERNTLLNNTLVNNVVGLEVISSNRNLLTDNTMSDNGIGMWLIESSFNTVANNEFQNNTRGILSNLPYGAWLVYGSLSYSFGWSSGALNLKWESSSNTIVGNTMIDSDFGVFLAGCSNNTFRTNTMASNVFNFAIDALTLPQFVQDIDDSNTVDGKPIIYWVNEHGRQVPENVGYVAIINSSDITIRNLDISNNLHGILVVSSNNSLISGNKIANCSSGIFIMQSYEQIPGELYPSINITVHSNIVVGSSVGVLLRSGEQHTVSSNNLCGNLAGIHVGRAERNIISGNTVTNSTEFSLDWRVRTDPRRASTLDAWWWYSPVVFLGLSPGISLETSNNTVVGNTMAYNEIGLAVGVQSRCGNNTIYHNNFINNTHYQVFIASKNVWDDGYPSGGNYWSDYTGVDEKSGPNQDQQGSDGMGDTPYVIDADNQDRYPLMSPWIDTDGDEMPDVTDPDDDNDGVPDADDAFPLDPTESVDTDGDGIGNNADTDDDNDGVNDDEDAFPLDSTETVDTDGDGIGNNADTDDDNDGVPDVDDAFPTDPSESTDTDGDGVGDNADTDDDNDGMPDSWEIENGLDPLDEADASLDPDGDGLTNLQEYQGGTDPNASDAQPFPMWIIIAAAITTITIATAAAATILLKKRKQTTTTPTKTYLAPNRGARLAVRTHTQNTSFTQHTPSPYV